MREVILDELRRRAAVLLPYRDTASRQAREEVVQIYGFVEAQPVSENTVSTKSDSGKDICHYIEIAKILKVLDSDAMAGGVIAKLGEALEASEARVKELEQLVSDVTTGLTNQLEASNSRCRGYREALESIRFAGQDYFDISAATKDGLIEHIIGLKEMARAALGETK